jgi:hypothetical protein
VPGEGGELLVREWPAIAQGGVALDVADAARPGDDGRDGGVAQDQAQRRLGHVVRADAEVGADRRDTPLDLGGAVVAQAAVAEVAPGEGRAGRDPPGQSALVEGDAHDDADAVFRAGGEQVLGRGLVEDVAMTWTVSTVPLRTSRMRCRARGR